MACGPIAGVPGVGLDDGVDASSSTGAASVSSSTGGATGVSGASGADPTSGESSDGPDKFDVGASGGDLPLDHGPMPGDPPGVCTQPDAPAAEVSAETPIGAVTMRAAAFGLAGGAKCPPAYRVLVAADLLALAFEIDRAEAGFEPLDAIDVFMDLPPGAPTPGRWPAAVVVHIGGTRWETEATVAVTSVTSLDAVAPHVEATVTGLDPRWPVQGTFAAPYCNSLELPPCGI